ncbi:transglutaminase domain-containing protein [Nonomuraea rhodomycinica]|uniref:Transglutaminase domain-containing protein n=1 Tax=Nonomuraea rhodomycinica TaxID=1712872 RepID=A0A7Y6M8M4_9ACTN|nr:transglutaminase domain-containing protein [Nonomuraea rhodomycinica]NUW38702.1 transglutaminase domain-containing protein [Nonomuraea rhodomycinica]
MPTLIHEHTVALFAELSDVAFYLLPAVLRDDVGFLRTNRMGECSLMARELVRIARQSGLEARTSYGLIVSVPFSTTHTWAELRIDGVWMPVDLLLPRALHAWKITTDQVWPERLSPRGLFHRLTATAEPLVAHGDALCRVSFSTGVVS